MAPRKGKRQSGEEASEEVETAPVRKRSRIGEDEDATQERNGTPIETPTKRRRGRPPGSTKKSKDQTNGNASAIGLNGLSISKAKPSTPSKAHGAADESPSRPLVRNADRSARRKSARNLLDRPMMNDASDGSDVEDDDLLARKIWEADEAAGSSDQTDDSEEQPRAEPIAAAAAKKVKSKAGRRKRKSATPPSNLPPHEQYFWQNRPGRVKTSNNTLSSLSLLSHEQYYVRTSAYDDPHASSHHYLHSLHTRSFPQWRFELLESFSICLYGYGSKKNLVTDFANYLHRHSTTAPKILIVNGHTPTLTLRTLLTSLAPLIYDCAPTALPKLPAQPRDLLSTLLSHLNDKPHIHIFINSLDAPPLRRGTTPALLAHLAAHPSISLLVTCDTLNFPLLWDVPTRDRYNFLFHDATTFLSYASTESANAEIPNVVDEVNELLGRSGRTIKGKEGVGFVLRSLPENARGLYRILISEVLASIDAGGDDDGGEGFDGGAEGGRADDDDDDDDDGGGLGGRSAATKGGIEYKTLYQKTVEEFICSSEMGFRQLLKEFWDHDMIVSKRESGAGGEVLGVPWRREEMEAILEELIG